MNLGLEGACALVAGGSRGIGYSICEELAREGCDVALFARDQAEVEASIARLRPLGRRVSGYRADLADRMQVRDAVQSMLSDYGRLDVLVVAASSLPLNADEASWRRGFEVDLLGTVHLTELVLEAMLSRRSGSILLVGSTAALEVGPLQPYRSFKAALIPFVKSLAIEHASDGIRVNLVSPGYVRATDGIWERMANESPDFYATSVARIPMGRMATPEEVARVATFLSSPAASYVNGTNVLVDGALTRSIR